MPLLFLDLFWREHPYPLCLGALVRLDGKQMASGLLQQQRTEWHRKRLKAAIKPKPEIGFMCTGIYRCDSCEGATVRVHRVIRAGRQAVDRARAYATCVDCAARWEV